MYTIKDLIRRANIVNRHGNAIVTDEETLTWQAFQQRIEAMSSTLIKNGLQKHERVAILSRNSSAYLEMMYAVLWAGAVVCPINTRFSESEISYCLQDLDGVWICCDDQSLPTVENLKSRVHGVRGLIFIGEEATPAGYITLESLRNGDTLHTNEEPSTHDLALIFFTGGTTGVSKGVMLTHSQILTASQQSSAGVRKIDRDDVYLHVAPMYHMGDGVMCFVTAMTCTANAFQAQFDLPSMVELCQRQKVSWVTLVPTMVYGLCQYLQQSGQSLPSLRGILYGGSPMAFSILENAMKTLPGCQFVQGYGSTEALSITMLEAKFHTLDEAGKRRLRSAGRPFRSVLLSIQDPSGKNLDLGEVGEICVRSNAVMKGYWRKPDMTKGAIYDGWFHTGDAGYLDDEGFLYIVDRVKDMVITGGENVYSAEVENVLQSHPEVEECAIVGLPDEKWGERVHAVVRLSTNSKVSEEALQQHCRNSLASYKVPKSIQFTDTPLPRTAIGKIKKNDLKYAVMKETQPQ